MHYRTLGRTGLKISVVGVGTWQFGGEWGCKSPEQVRANAAAASLDLGQAGHPQAT